ncbi:MAG: ribulose-phosphate 3-epimerase [Planctomycetota bacterium]|nr:MAG: ribulose-phosphate 3-epimerase [Planctomycetota bacterium]
MSQSPIIVLPSLLSCDFARLADELAACAAAGASQVHVDVMDAHFVPNLTLGPLLVEAMRRSTDLVLDVHLMMTDPLRYAQSFRDAGADAITVHVEAVGPRAIDDAISQLRSTGAATGLAFNPDTDPCMWFDALAQVDQCMLMTVYPGFGGQAFIPAVRPRIRAVRERFPQLPIMVDGGIDRSTIPLVVADGATRLVCGSAYFKDPDPAALIRWAQAGEYGDV